MKAIGKGSIASILSAGLHVVRAIVFLGFVGLSVAAVVMPLIALFAGATDNIEHVTLDGQITGGDYVKVMFYFVTFGVMLFIVNRLLEILRTLRFGSPFVKENAIRFRQVGYALLLAEAAKIAFGILDAIFDAEIEYEGSFMIWIAILAVFVLAEVFHEGAKMKEEQDLTV